MKEINLDKSNRAYFKENKLSYWLSLAVSLAGGQKPLARATGVEQNNIFGYVHNKTHSIRGDILFDIINFLNENRINTAELLKDVKEITDVHEPKRKTISKAREALVKKYGKNAFVYIHSISAVTLQRIYGQDYMKVLSKKGCQTLKEKYGEGAFKIITLKGFKALEKKYGKNWHAVLGKLSYEAKTKRGFAYLKKPIGIVYRKEKLTNQESKITSALKRADIAYQTHVMLRGYYECDIIIPRANKPEICLEVSNTTPQTSNLYRKISQLFVRKMLLTESKFILLIPESKDGKNQKFHARPDLVKFLLDEGIMVFWSTEIDKLVSYIKSFLDGEDCTNFLNEKYRWCNKNFDKRRKHAVSSAQKEATNILDSERAIIEKLNLRGEKKVIFNKYNWPIVLDLANDNNLYEITTALGHSALETISGKIFYLNKTLSGYKLNLILYSSKDFPTKELIENLCKIIVAS